MANFTNIESELIRMFDPVLYFFVKSTSFSTGIVFWSREDSSVGGGLSASAGEFHIVLIKKKVVIASVGEICIVPVKKGHLCR